jgi:putative toxin-antitoxin system antitoxin component (TIGR02293 family)
LYICGVKKKSYNFSKEEQNSLEVNEPISLYMKSPNFDQFFTDKFQIVQLIKKGLSHNVFEQIKSLSPFTELEWANFLDVSTKSLSRYKEAISHTFKSSHTEKILSIVEVNKVAMDIFKSKDKYEGWLRTTNFALGNERPVDLLASSYGRDLVLSELTRIQHGIFI